MKAIIAGAIVALIASPAVAGFVENRAQWNALGGARQGDYVMGLIDRMTIMDATSPYGQANALGTVDCMRALDLNNSSLVDIINEGYARSASTWGEFPGIVLDREMTTICRTYINARRESEGLQRLPEPTAR